MARTVRNAKIDTRSARVKLTERREPYWTVVSSGCAIGYRRGAKGGTWIGRFRAQDGALGSADDARDADGLTVFSFPQAQERARTFFARKARALAGHSEPSTGPYTVTEAVEAYFADRERRGSKGLAQDRAAAAVRILPALGKVELTKLTAKRIRDWHTALAAAPKLFRSSRLNAERKSREIDTKDTEAVRARRATANRTLTVLKAALNHAFHEGGVAGDEAWRKVKPFREADAPVIHYLTQDEWRRLINACDGSFRYLVQAALLTGCRYGELIRMRAADFNADAGTIAVRESKAGKPRHVALTDEGQALFAALTAGRLGSALVFVRDDSRPWGKSHQQKAAQRSL